jgi:hypothetical protein
VAGPLDTAHEETRTMRRSTTFAMTAALAVGLALTGCAQDGAAVADRTPSATDAAATSAPAAPADPTDTATPAPTPTSTAAAEGSVPSSCSDLITAGKWDDSFAAAPLNDPSVVGDPITIPKGGFTDALQPDGKRLYCVWKDPRTDISYLSIQVDAVDAAAAPGVLDALSGYDCVDADQGRSCQKTSQDQQYPVTDGDTYFTGGGIGIRIQQANIPTDGLLDDVVAHVF